jgi:hypothetical protein
MNASETDHDLEVDGDKARQGITGVHLRYILGVGIAAAVVAFFLLATA